MTCSWLVDRLECGPLTQANNCWLGKFKYSAFHAQGISTQNDIETPYGGIVLSLCHGVPPLARMTTAALQSCARSAPCWGCLQSHWTHSSFIILRSSFYAHHSTFIIPRSSLSSVGTAVEVGGNRFPAAFVLCGI